MDTAAVSETFFQLHVRQKQKAFSFCLFERALRGLGVRAQAQHPTVWTHEVVIGPGAGRLATRL